MYTIFMKSFQRIFLLLFFLLFSIIGQKYLYSNQPFSQNQPIHAVQGSSTSSCHINGVLPDPNCTPGLVDPNVTQDTIFQTICVKGYTKTVRPPVDYTNKLKIQQIREYGYVDTNPRNYEEDHLISLELGGSPTDPKNLWPEPGASPNQKDTIENLCREKVCSDQLSLSEAQKEIATNWQTACQ